MTAEYVLPVPRDGLTWDDLQAIPDEAHHHYELIEGQILMSPSPGLHHQRCVFNLALALRQAASPEFEVILAPFDFNPEPGTVLQPDVLVIRRGTAEAQRVVVPPVLAIEVLSPSHPTVDRVTKRALYARFGIEHYWLVDPAGPAIEVLRRDGLGYVDVVTVTGGDTLHVDAPFELAVSPSALTDD